tara:strand:+ start:9644 stop:10303 length:660 start_codon:yes stop_codon:yes gene_type:complete
VKKFLICLSIFLLSIISPFGYAQNFLGPKQIVQGTADSVLAEVNLRREELEADSTLIYPLVEKMILPHFDFEAMTRFAMGRFWRYASSQQQRRLIAEFQELLVRTYATALLSYSGQDIEYFPINFLNEGREAIVPTKIAYQGGPPIPINYRLRIENQDNTWLVFDVVIDGISLVTNYRSTFVRLIRVGGGGERDRRARLTKGIDNLIKVLSKKNDRSTK